MEIALLASVLVALIGILAALKKGFNEVIAGLEAIDQRLSRDRQSLPVSRPP